MDRDLSRALQAVQCKLTSNSHVESRIARFSVDFKHDVVAGEDENGTGATYMVVS